MTSPVQNPTVPWAVAGGANNSIEHARMIPWAIYQGSEGVLGNLDLEVKALATPGGSVQVMPGGYVVVARGLGQTYESYMGKFGSAVTVAVDPNNTASPRSDLLMLRIEDPHVAGEPWTVAPGAVNDGPYRSFHIEKGVASTTRSVRQLGNTWSAIPLARIDIPANTATITQAMIVPLRTKCSPPSPPVPPPTIIIIEDDDGPDNPDFLYSRIVSGPSSAFNFSSSSQNTWRSMSTIFNEVIPIPRWANRAEIMALVHNMSINEDIHGETRVNISDTVYTSANMYDVNYHGGPGPESFILPTGGTVTIPSSFRGKCKRFKLEARSLSVSPSHTGTMTYHRGSLLEVRIIFKEQCS
jgi:hypothetical protein